MPRPVEPETYQCPDCDNKAPIQRLSSRKKAAGHLKWMWCARCKKTTNHERVSAD